MTIDEAIEHAIQVADSYKDTVPDCDCARDHRQLAEWLKKARIYEKVKKMSVSMIRKLKKENDKLRELVYDMLEDEERGHNDDRTFREHVVMAHKYGIAKDIEVE